MRAWISPVLMGVAALALSACQPALAPAPKTDPRLDALFAELQSAPNRLAAERAEQEIWAIWGESGSPTVDVLLERAETAEAKGDITLAREFLDEAARLAPNYAEVWNRRAILSYGADEYGPAMRDIQETLQREPRHFGALAGLAVIYEALGQERAALEAYRAALAIHPHLEEAKRGEARLAPKIDGQDA